MKRTLSKTVAAATGLVKTGDLLGATALIQGALGLVAAPKDVLAAIKPRLEALTGKRARTTAVSPTASPTVPRENGRFIDGSLAVGGLDGRYKLFIPSAPAAHASLVVLLHGCTQDPDDFAAGTAMNVRADEQGFYVLYPMQSSSANQLRCWNWFRRDDQMRDRGEPALIAAMTRDVVQRYDVDADCVYVAGLSAGGAMAAILGARYPDLYAAVGVHSGLAAGAASNIPDALAAMRNGSRRGRRETTSPVAVPTIVFHGDRDTTVHPSNGTSVIEAIVGTGTDPVLADGTSPGGKRFNHSTYLDGDGKVVAEHWVVAGLAHAWSGGSPAGTHTDATGPSATDEMLRFFKQHRMRRDRARAA